MSKGILSYVQGLFGALPGAILRSPQGYPELRGRAVTHANQAGYQGISDHSHPDPAGVTSKFTLLPRSDSP